MTPNRYLLMSGCSYRLRLRDHWGLHWCSVGWIMDWIEWKTVEKWKKIHD
jgi:hypothetical protein